MLPLMPLPLSDTPTTPALPLFDAVDISCLLRHAMIIAERRRYYATFFCHTHDATPCCYADAYMIISLLRFRCCCHMMLMPSDAAVIDIYDAPDIYH